jgi:dTDP-4-dehydrorhamnose reductase
MRVFITGGTGLLGKALVETGRARHEICAAYYGDYSLAPDSRVSYVNLEIRDQTGYSRIFTDFHPEVVIHTAGVSSPDYAERHRREAIRINVGGTQNIAGCCRRIKAKLVFVSSNGVYSGENAPYSEDDRREPVNFYGSVKLQGEEMAKKAGVPCAIVRPILMYGWNYAFERQNVVTWAISRLRAGSKVSVYEDVYANPLYSQFCAQAIWKIAEEGKYDTFNIAGGERASIFGLIKMAAEVFALDSRLVSPVRQGSLRELVRRPKDTTYNTQKMQSVLGLKPLSLGEGLALMKEAAVLNDGQS